jgi:hypothetical protein
MSTLLQCNFTGTDGTDLTAYTPDVGAAGSAVGGTWTIQGNKASPPNGSAGAIFLWETNASDCVLSCVIAIPSASIYSYVMHFRSVDLNNRWLITLQRDGGGTPHMDITEVTSGVGNIRATIDVTGLTGTTVTLTLTLNGTSIVPALNTGETTSYSSSVRQTVTTHGLGVYTQGGYDPNGTFDNLLVTSLVSAPSTPTGLAHGTVTSSTIPLTWDAMAGATGYLVKIDTVSNFANDYPPIDTASAMTTPLALESNTTYYIKVAAYNVAGVSAYCVAITATTLEDIAPLVAPTLTLVSKTATNIIVNVGAASGGTPPYEYSVTVGTSSGDTNVADSNIAAAGRVNIVTDLGIGPLTPETTYYINAWVDDAGAGDRIAGNELVVRTRAISSGRLSIGGSGVSFGRGLNIGSGAGVQF